MTETTVIRSVLVANRGEIARRVFRTCRDLGIRTVAVHTDLDADALHVRDADVAVRVASYLDGDAVLAAAKETGADAIHPGYGFLSENAGFARAVAGAGIAWVGPSPEVIEQMGRKDAARDLAVAAGVPVVPSYDIDDDPATFAYPVLAKAAAGGGGKGMRVVRSAAELTESVAAAKREAINAFGDDTILIEKYVERGRHIEVQVLGDSHGHVVHLGTRECSVQRRHQKVIEEAPAPALDDELRERIHASAVALSASVGYSNAGTIEYLLDAATGDFYFLEMNTRLQVEHPVTEIHSGTDLVELQLAVAAGEPLPFDQAGLRFRDHAMEARIYAEDAFGGFLPQAGTAALVSWPASARVDHALESGQVVSTSYDPMLGKVIVSGPNREAARRALVAALDDTTILGLTTNTGFLRVLAASEEFAEPGGIDTAWLDRNDVPAPDPAPARQIAARLWLDAHSEPGGPFAGDGFRMGSAPAPTVVEFTDGSVTVSPTQRHRPRGLKATEPMTQRVSTHEVELAHQGQRYVFVRPDASTDHGAAVSDGTIVAPMPGTVLDVRVAAGDQVTEGQVLGVVEAMKMELALKAPHDGTVASVGATVGQQVALGAELFVVTGAEEQA
ncbi:MULTISPECIES: acetyl/propionyl/methylcrotonyl-CoA carboxylase subunit alpha [unclassified Nocardioides]|uniref:acetyl/propionyl/methylcrotonyl-CoA carboxylase subunit alpha n=1 Tax=unclassified Nocardioides TaxID=2615069 RepID=UPI000702DD03|nr:MULTISPECIES: biotin carboxylase N-terminal domain-containing protein [unclassified Nocardioides]KRC53651.1 carbamoyl-phosphate synthase subunit L [Nocardioides sp. Root79]KRC72806.1 carbamoyl-phosphate synthase subunit L [Nocardioides sp. Root240]